MSDPDVTPPEIETRRLRRISPVWIVPALAALIGGIVAWQSVAQQGPLVEILFDKGHGIQAGRTEIKHNDVVVGIVEDVTLTDGLERVLVKARMEKVVAPYLGDTTDFWIVSANISGTNLSGLGTLLSGAYIEVDWAERARTRQRKFIGLDVQPLTPPGTQGRHFRLRTLTAGSLSVGSPVFYRGIRVGQVESRRLTEDFSHVEYEAFVEAPYDTLMNPATHFWNVSGVSVEAGTDGLQVKMASLEALLAGGVAFGDIGVNLSTASLPDEAVFTVFADRNAAMESQFGADEGDGFFFMATFEDSIEGLDRGAPLEWQGIRIGTVRDIVLDLGDGPTDGQVVYAVLELNPSRIGLKDVKEEDVRLAIDAWVASGMRAQLASGNILTGKKLVKFVDGIGADERSVDFAASPHPAIPTAPSQLGALAQNIEQVVAKVAALPLDQLIGSAVTLLNDADALLADPNTKQLPAELNEMMASFGNAAVNIDTASRDLPKLIASLNAITQAGELALAGLSPGSELYVELAAAMQDLRDASRSLAGLATRLEQNPNALLTGR